MGRGWGRGRRVWVRGRGVRVMGLRWVVGEMAKVGMVARALGWYDGWADSLQHVRIYLKEAQMEIAAVR